MGSALCGRASDSVSMNRRDWELRFGAIWPLFDGAKSYFDPDNILTPGQGIF
jgi:FAD/FMN-containing dehydrogenase